ncbi:MAG TPA: R3H domain-containing nucleic acid-binding protein [Solirubrobacteraceae bacterium]|nr:R3H domain-containing nucleic acid-binding protein [Solirubrobacteraceae bacterium]
MAHDEELAGRVRELLERVVQALGLVGSVDVSDDGETLTGTVHGEQLGLFIGHHGQTIDAVQHLATRIVLRDGEGPRRRVVIDAEGYRARRREALEGQASDAADEALRFGRPVALDAMTASERRIVHEHLRDRADVRTHSEGDEPERHLVISPATD